MQVFVLLGLLGIALAAQLRFDGHKVYRMQVDADNPSHIAAYKELREHPEWLLDFWEETDVRVPPHLQASVAALLDANGIAWHVMVEDVQALIDAEAAHRRAVRAAEAPNQRLTDVTASGYPAFFDDYRSLAEIDRFVDELARAHPGLVSLATIGHSYEQRPIRAVQFSTNGMRRPVSLYLEAGIHAREWVSHSTVAFLMHQFATRYQNDSRVRAVLDRMDVAIVPVVNPDGYNYTWARDRMWRKTRKPNAGSSCIGTDPNRNWDSHWCEAGADRNPCSEAFCGNKAFSEVEVVAVANYLKQLGTVKGLVDFHSYSQFWMRPYGYTSKQPADAASQKELGQAAVQAIKNTHGKSYKEGTIFATVYPASGSSADWAYDTLNVTWAYGVELRDQGFYGFLLPANQIVPSGEEIWAAVLTMAEYIISHA